MKIRVKSRSIFLGADCELLPVCSIGTGIWSKTTVWLPLWTLAGCSLCLVLFLMATYTCRLTCFPWSQSQGLCSFFAR